MHWRLFERDPRVALRGQRGCSERSCRQRCIAMQGSCHLGTTASGQCALSSACTDLVSGRIDLLSWLFVAMCVGVGICW